MQVRAVLIFLAVRLRYGRDDVALLYFVAGFQPFFRLYIFVDCLYSVAVIDDNLRTYKDVGSIDTFDFSRTRRKDFRTRRRGKIDTRMFIVVVQRLVIIETISLLILTTSTGIPNSSGVLMTS